MEHIPLILSIVLGATTLVSTTIAIMRGQQISAQAIHISNILVIIEAMKEVDSGLLAQIAELRGIESADIRLLSMRIDNITKLLEEIRENTRHAVSV